MTPDKQTNTQEATADIDTAAFAALGLRSSVCQGLAAASFEQPTEIQAQLIPYILAGHDVFGQARTGTGKTAAFSLPVINNADKDIPGQALILVPTRELAMQVETEINRLGKFTPIRALAIYGGQRIQTQANALQKNRPPIIVGTPGRIMDMHERRFLPYDNIKIVILDEVDRMLDIGFRDDIRKILSTVPGKPQCIFVSATLSEEIERLASRYMKDPQKITTSEGALTVKQVQQEYITVNPWDKRSLLLHILKKEDPDLTLVFCRTKYTVDQLARHLSKKGIEVHALHGDMPQSKRNAIVHKLKHGHLSVVVASDLAARGLDVSGISHVVNYDLPEDPEVYVHRIGRTARAGRDGHAWSLVTPEEGKLLTNIEMLANTEIRAVTFDDFKPTDPPPGRDDAPAQAPTEPKKPRSAGPESVWKKSQNELDSNKFPGGVAPKGPPKRTMGGKMPRRGRR